MSHSSSQVTLGGIPSSAKYAINSTFDIKNIKQQKQYNTSKGNQLNLNHTDSSICLNLQPRNTSSKEDELNSKISLMANEISRLTGKVAVLEKQKSKRKKSKINSQESQSSSSSNSDSEERKKQEKKALKEQMKELMKEYLNIIQADSYNFNIFREKFISEKYFFRQESQNEYQQLFLSTLQILIDNIKRNNKVNDNACTTKPDNNLTFQTFPTQISEENSSFSKISPKQLQSQYFSNFPSNQKNQMMTSINSVASSPSQLQQITQQQLQGYSYQPKQINYQNSEFRADTNQQSKQGNNQISNFNQTPSASSQYSSLPFFTSAKNLNQKKYENPIQYKNTSQLSTKTQVEQVFGENSSSLQPNPSPIKKVQSSNSYLCNSPLSYQEESQKSDYSSQNIGTSSSQYSQYQNILQYPKEMSQLQKYLHNTQQYLSNNEIRQRNSQLFPKKGSISTSPTSSNPYLKFKLNVIPPSADDENKEEEENIKNRYETQREDQIIESERDRKFKLSSPDNYEQQYQTDSRQSKASSKHTLERESQSKYLDSCRNEETRIQLKKQPSIDSARQIKSNKINEGENIKSSKQRRNTTTASEIEKQKNPLFNNQSKRRDENQLSLFEKKKKLQTDSEVASPMALISYKQFDKLSRYSGTDLLTPQEELKLKLQIKSKKKFQSGAIQSFPFTPTDINVSHSQKIHSERIRLNHSPDHSLSNISAYQASEGNQDWCKQAEPSCSVTNEMCEFDSISIFSKNDEKSKKILPSNDIQDSQKSDHNHHMASSKWKLEQENKNSRSESGDQNREYNLPSQKKIESRASHFFKTKERDEKIIPDISKIPRLKQASPSPLQKYKFDIITNSKINPE